MIEEIRRMRSDPAIIAASLITNVFALALPVALLHVFDRVVPNRGIETMAVLAAGLFIFVVLDFAIRTARFHIVALSTVRFALSTHWQACQRVLHPAIDVGFLGHHEIFDKFDAIARVRRHYGGEVAIAFYDIPFVLLFIGVIVLISPIMGFGAALLALGSLAVVARHRRRIIALGHERVERGGRRHAFLSETLSRIEMIKALGIEPEFARRHEKLMSVNAAQTREFAERVSFTQGLAGTISLVSPVVMACLGSFLVIDERMTMGGLAAAILLTNRIIQPILRIEALIAGERDVRSHIEDVARLLDAPLRHAGTTAVDRIEHLDISGVTLSEDGRTLLREVDLSLRSGDAIAIDGHDAAASAAILELICGHLIPTDGEVRIDGRLLQDCDPMDLSRRIGRLGADHVMLEGTLLENMTRFDPGEYRQAAFDLSHRIGIENFIAGLAQGFSTPMSVQTAATLPKAVQDCALIIGSLVSKPNVILFDEAMLGLDRQLASRLEEFLSDLRPDVILIVVTYRPEGHPLADRHFRIRDGRLVEASASPVSGH